RSGGVANSKASANSVIRWRSALVTGLLPLGPRRTVPDLEERSAKNLRNCGAPGNGVTRYSVTVTAKRGQRPTGGRRSLTRRPGRQRPRPTSGQQRTVAEPPEQPAESLAPIVRALRSGPVGWRRLWPAGL